MTEPKRTSFEIYHKKEGFYWTNNRIVFFGFTFCFLLFIIKYHVLGLKENSIFDKVVGFSALGSFAYGIVMKIIGIVRYKPLRGKLEGLLILEMDKISIGNQVYNLDDIRTIKILNYDYYGRAEFERYSFEANLSRGVDNKFEITLNSGEIISCAFFQLFS